MFRYHYCGFCILFSFVVLASATAQDLCKIKGRFENLRPERCVASYLDRYHIHREVAFTPSDDGEFEIEIDNLDKGTYVSVYAVSFRWNLELFVVPDTTVTVSGNCKTPAELVATLSFAGDLAEANVYLATCAIDETLKRLEWDHRSTSMGIEELDRQLAAAETRQRELLSAAIPDEIADKHVELARFRKVEQANISARRPASLFSFIMLKRMQGRDGLDAFDNIIKPLLLDYQLADKMASAEGIRNLYGHSLIRFKMMKLRESDPDLFEIHKSCGWMLMLSDSLFPDGPLKQFAIAEAFQSELNNPLSENTLADLERYFERYRDCLNSELQKHILQQFVHRSKLRLGLTAGKPAPSFEYETVDGGRHSIAENRGRFLLVHVWASWCAPCIATFPHDHKLLRDFENERLTLLSVSVDQDKEAWKAADQKYSPAGTSVRVKGGLSGPFAKKYGITGLPRYILIDTDGNLVEAFAPPPGSDALRDRLEKLVD